MGYFGHWLVVRDVDPSDLRAIGLRPTEETVAGQWRYAFGDRIPDNFDWLLAQASRYGSGVAIGAWFFDSDYSQVIAIAPGMRATLALGSRYPDEPLEHDPGAFADWTSVAPKPLTRAEVDVILRRDDFFVEDTVDELLDRVGLPAPYDPHEGPRSASGDLMHPSSAPESWANLPPRATTESVDAGRFGGYVAPLGSMHDWYYVDPIKVPWRELRYVPGIGHGFLGIWDRESPEGPMATFPVSKRGEVRLDEALGSLCLPLRLKALSVDRLQGFLEPVWDLSAVYGAAGRLISMRDAPFVVGRGADFIGVWDRSKPWGPIDRFPLTEEGEDRAEDRVVALLFEHFISTKTTGGLRQYSPASPARWVRLQLPPPFDSAATESYRQLGGMACLLIEEDEDARWRVNAFSMKGPFHVYGFLRVSGLECLGAYETVEAAKPFAMDYWGASDSWHDVPEDIPHTLKAVFEWARRQYGE